MENGIEVWLFVGDDEFGASVSGYIHGQWLRREEAADGWAALL